jgi:hexulose-6-phosphate isomerase
MSAVPGTNRFAIGYAGQMNRRGFLVSTFAMAHATMPAIAAPSRFTKSICSIIFPDDLPYTERFRQARNAGFDGIELRLGQEIRMDATPDEVKRMGQAAREAGIRIASIWASQPESQNPLNSRDPAVRARHLETLHAAIDIAAWLECGAILLVPGGLGRKFQIGYQETWDLLSAELPKIIPYAAEKKVILTPENVGNKFLTSPIDMRNFIDQFHSPNLQAHFDVGNVVQTGFPEDWILTLGSRIKRLHVKDYKFGARGEPGRYVNLGEGDIDWRGVIAALVKVGYSGFVSPEIRGDPNDPERINKISRALDKILSLA